MKKRLLLWCVAASLLGMLTACGDLSKLSSTANVDRFSIDTIYTESAQLGIPAVNKQTAEIEIPLIYGKYIPNIKFRAQISLEKDSKQLLNLNPDTVTIATWTTPTSFYVTAENGAVREWMIRLVPVAQDSAADIQGMAIASWAPENSIVADSAFVFIDGMERYVKVIAPQASFPLSVMPEYVLSDGAFVVGGSQELSFNSRLDTKSVSIEAKDGFVQQWTVYAETGEAIYADNQASYLSDQIWPVNVDAQSLQATGLTGAGNELMRVETDSLQNVITLVVRNSGQPGGAPVYPLSVSFDFERRFNQMCVGYNPGSPITFERAESVSSFYLYDCYNDLKKLWKVRTEAYRNNEAEVASFALTRSQPSSVRFDLNETEINSENATITLVVSEGADAFPLQLRANIGVSEGATLFGIENGKDFVMEDINSQKDFMVIAEDGTEKQWTIRLVFAGTLSSDADVETFRIISYHGAGGMLQLDPTGLVNKENKTITVSITAKGSDLPLQLKAAMSTSYKATIIDGAFTSNDFLTFNSLTDTYVFKLRSQDGQTENTWTIRLVDNSPAAGTAAELVTFKANNVAAGYSVAETIVDASAKTIKLRVTSKGSGAFSFIPAISVSEGAQVAGITNGVRLNFASLNDAKTFSITSEDGAVQNRWRIIISYEPPIVNGAMNWSGGELTGWSTSNTRYATIAQSGTGPDGSSCTYLTATSVLGNFAAGSIFLGRFVMDISQVSNPKAMTYFGIPFDGRPVSISADVNAQPGSGDKCQITIQLLNYAGSGSIEYHKYGSVNSQGIFVADASREPGVTVVAHGAADLDNTGGWARKTVPISYYYTDAQKPVTHIFVSFTTSYKGDELRGSTSSKMWVDNVTLDY